MVQGDHGGFGQTLYSGPVWLLHRPWIESLYKTTMVTLYKVRYVRYNISMISFLDALAAALRRTKCQKIILSAVHRWVVYPVHGVRLPVVSDFSPPLVVFALLGFLKSFDLSQYHKILCLKISGSSLCPRSRASETCRRRWRGRTGRRSRLPPTLREWHSPKWKVTQIHSTVIDYIYIFCVS